MPNDDITGRQVAAARVLAGVSRNDIATKAKISLIALAELEAEGSAPVAAETAHALRSALEHFGVLFVPESEDVGAGVRLKFTRRDSKQINRLENEGGPAGDDDVP